MQESADAIIPGDVVRGVTAAAFRRRFRWLVFHTWNIPPIVGLSFILFIGVLTPDQLLGILVTPLEPAYIIGWLLFALWYLPRQIRPLADWLERAPQTSAEAAIQAVRRFPVQYWGLFLAYLLLAPASVIVAAEIYTDFVAKPIDWFRIELVALIVSIVVGLPIFFLVFDLFGKAVGGLAFKRPIFSIRTKVFVIGALTPLLIDTMLVQYYWTRTDFFTAETFMVWLLLEAIAIGGSVIFARSFGQSLAPLRTLLDAPRPTQATDVARLVKASTDELGVLTGDYRSLLQELQKHRDQLEQLVHERTDELEAFSYSVSHDLRTPLRAIDGFSNALLEDCGDRLDATARGHLDRVRTAAQRMSRMIDDMLEMSRISRSAMRLASADLAGIAHDIVSQLRAAHPGSNTTVEISQTLTAHCDARLVTVALANLLDNAWKYTSKSGEPRIEFGQVRLRGERVFYVRDNGAGFDMRYADKLFGLFERLHGPEYPGTGIGLATVARVIRRHGGRVWAESAVGRGSTFYFTLGEPPGT